MSSTLANLPIAARRRGLGGVDFSGAHYQRRREPQLADALLPMAVYQWEAPFVEREHHRAVLD